jgi:hypothetical protein
VLREIHVYPCDEEEQDQRRRGTGVSTGGSSTAVGLSDCTETRSRVTARSALRGARPASKGTVRVVSWAVWGHVSSGHDSTEGTAEERQEPIVVDQEPTNAIEQTSRGLVGHQRHSSLQISRRQKHSSRNKRANKN